MMHSYVASNTDDECLKDLNENLFFSGATERECRKLLSSYYALREIDFDSGYLDRSRYKNI